MGEPAAGRATIRRIDGEYGIWQAPGRALTIEYRSAALHEISVRAGEASRAFGRNGYEIGGVLFGRHQGNLVQVVAALELTCEHAHGPGFVLSEPDEAALKELIAAPDLDPALAGLAPVGWYASHIRAGVALSEADIRLHDRFFSEPWQVVLIVQPVLAGPTPVGFFCRDVEGRLKPGPSDAEFEIYASRNSRRGGRASLAIAERAPSGRPAPHLPERTPYVGPTRSHAPIEPQPEAAPAPVAEVPAEPPPPAQAPPPPALAGTAVHPPVAAVSPALPERPTRRNEDAYPAHGRRRVPLWLAAILAALALFAAGFYFGARPGASLLAPAPPPLGLKVLDASGQLLVTWDRNAEPVRASRRAVLEITDGERKSTLPLDAAAVSQGSATYARNGPRVDVWFTVFPERGRTAREYASFLGQPPPAARSALQEGPAAADAAARERDRAVREAAQLRATVASQHGRINQLEEALQVLRKRAQVEESLRRRRR